MARLTNDDILALLKIRDGLILDHNRLLDGPGAPQAALVKQTDVSAAMSKAIKALEEVLAVAGGVKFE